MNEKLFTERCNEKAHQFVLALNLGSIDAAFTIAPELNGNSNFALFAVQRGNIDAVIGLLHQKHGRLDEKLVEPYMAEIIRHKSLGWVNNNVLKEHGASLSSQTLRKNLRHAARYGQLEAVDALLRSNSNGSDQLTKADMFMPEDSSFSRHFNGFPIHIEAQPRTDHEMLPDCQDLKVRMENRLRWLADNKESLTRKEVLAKSGAPPTTLLELAIERQFLGAVLDSLEASGEMLQPEDIKNVIHVIQRTIKWHGAHVQLETLFDKRIWKGHGAEAQAFFAEHDSFTQCSDFDAARSAMANLGKQEHITQARVGLGLDQRKEGPTSSGAERTQSAPEKE